MTETMETPPGGAASIRNATADDAGAIAALHTASWRVAYRGILPDAYLDDRLDDEKDEQWRLKFAAPSPGDLTLVCVGPEGLQGFIAIKADETLHNGVYIDNLHAEPQGRRRGVGRRLMRAAAERLVADGVKEAWLTVLGGNENAVAFYERMGGQRGLTLSERMDDRFYPTYVYFWLDIRTLLDRPS